jgi:hypothetical protein
MKVIAVTLTIAALAATAIPASAGPVCEIVKHVCEIVVKK